MGYEIVCADILEWAESYEGSRFHAITTDPPYELNFMGAKWDNTGIAFRPSTWKAIAQHLRPGGLIMAFASSKGWHRMAVAMEDAGLLIQPSVFVYGVGEIELPMFKGWIQSQSFPKATSPSKLIDRRANAEREVVGEYQWPDGGSRDTATHKTKRDGGIYSHIKADDSPNDRTITAPATPLAAAWEGHRYGGQVLKDSLAPIIIAQKPWEGNRLDCLTETGAGAYWVDGGRVETDDSLQTLVNETGERDLMGAMKGKDITGRRIESRLAGRGRWPPSLALCHVAPHPCPACNGTGCEECEGTGLAGRCVREGVKKVRGSHSMGKCEGKHYSDEEGMFGTDNRAGFDHVETDGKETTAAWKCIEGCPVAVLGEQGGKRDGRGNVNPSPRGKSEVCFTLPGNGSSGPEYTYNDSDSGTCTRFYPQFGWELEVMERVANAPQVYYCPKAGKSEKSAGLDGNRNPHKTVKPLSLAIWLCKLLLPPPLYAPRRILIPFGGVASEGIGALLAGWEEIVIVEKEAEYCEVGQARMAFWKGWVKRGHSDVKEILKSFKKESRDKGIQLSLIEEVVSD